MRARARRSFGGGVGLVSCRRRGMRRAALGPVRGAFWHHPPARSPRGGLATSQTPQITRPIALTRMPSRVALAIAGFFFALWKVEPLSVSLNPGFCAQSAPKKYFVRADARKLIRFLGLAQISQKRRNPRSVFARVALRTPRPRSEARPTANRPAGRVFRAWSFRCGLASD